MNSSQLASHSSGAALQTGGEILPNGTALELGRSLAGEELSLLYWNGSSLVTKGRVEKHGHIYVPPRLHSRFAQELFLPTRLIRHKQTGQLLSELETLFRRSFNLAGRGATLLALFVLASWIPELLPAAACIVLHGPFVEVTAMLRLLHHLCRHAVLLGELDQRSFQNPPVEKLKLTLLIAQLAQDVKTARLMQISNARELFTPYRKSGQDLFCCEVIADYGAITVDGALDVTILPGHHNGMQSSQDLLSIAEQFQPKLFGYRLASATGKLSAGLDAAWACSPAAGCCQALLTTVASDTKLAAATKNLLAVEAEHASANVVTAQRAMLLECALALSHEKNKDRIQVKEFCDALNAALMARGESLQLNSKQVGRLLPKIGLQTRELHGVFVVELMNEVRRHIHELALLFNVPSIRKRSIRCSFCEQVWGTATPAEVRQSVQ